MLSIENGIANRTPNVLGEDVSDEMMHRLTRGNAKAVYGARHIYLLTRLGSCPVAKHRVIMLPHAFR
jgi:hypothetical protein